MDYILLVVILRICVVIGYKIDIRYIKELIVKYISRIY